MPFLNEIAFDFTKILRLFLLRSLLLSSSSLITTGNVNYIFSSTIVIVVIVNAKWLQSILIIYTIELPPRGILFKSLY